MMVSQNQIMLIPSENLIFQETILNIILMKLCIANAIAIFPTHQI
jgi:hypothetical protein